jgi:hypothetical protein
MALKARLEGRGDASRRAAQVASTPALPMCPRGENSRHFRYNKMNNLFMKLKETNNGIINFRSSVKEIRNRTEILSERVLHLNKTISTLEKENKDLKKIIERFCCFGKDNNLLIYQLDETSNESWEELEYKLLDLFNNKMSITVNRADLSAFRRIGNIKGHRPVLLKMNSSEAKLLILQNAYKLTGQNVYIDLDVSQEDSEVRRALASFYKKLKSEGKQVKLKTQFLIVNGRRWTLEDLLEKEETKENQEEWGSEEEVPTCDKKKVLKKKRNEIKKKKDGEEDEWDLIERNLWWRRKEAQLLRRSQLCRHVKFEPRPTEAAK